MTTDRDTIQLIVKYLGRAAVVGLITTGALVAGVLWLSRGKGTVDAAAIALVGLIAQPVSGAMAALPSLLASTRSAPTKAELSEALEGLPAPAPTPVVGVPGGEPVMVAEAAPGGAPAPPPPPP